MEIEFNNEMGYGGYFCAGENPTFEKVIKELVRSAVKQKLEGKIPPWRLRDIDVIVLPTDQVVECDEGYFNVPVEIYEGNKLLYSGRVSGKLMCLEKKGVKEPESLCDLYGIPVWGEGSFIKP